MPGPILIKGVRIGIPICEDIWGAEVVECLSETGGEILLVPNGSPYWRGKTEHRLNIAVARVVESGLPLIYLNMVGGQDELVFDGASFVLNADRSVGAQLPTFRETVALTEWKREAGGVALRRRADRASTTRTRRPTTAPACWGLRDYVDKNGFKGVVLGLSGGIDSALCAAMAVDALGTDRVRCVMLPYRFTSQDFARRRRRSARRRSACSTTSCRSRARCWASRQAVEAGVRRHARATSPRKTSRRARAA